MIASGVFSIKRDINYQRYLWNGLFAQVDVMPAFQTFVNENKTLVRDASFLVYTCSYEQIHRAW